MRRPPTQALFLLTVLALSLAIAAAASGGCRKKIDPLGYHPPKPTAVPYKPPKPPPTAVWPTPRPGQPRLRPTMPG